MNSIEQHLDQVFEYGAKRWSEQIKGKTCSYRLDGMGYTVKKQDTGKTGTCQILGVHYNRQLDCNVYDLLDLETKKEFHPCEFEVWLKDL